MEKKINIAELLKDCPSGMELDCTLFENLKFNYIKEDTDFPIKCFIENESSPVSFNKYGKFNTHNKAKCVIFPKGKTTWEGFQRPFKDGDIIFTHANCLKVGLGNTWISIFQEKRNGGVATYVDMTEDGKDYYDYIDGDKGLLCMNEDIIRQRLATEEEKQKLFDAIKANGYKWNPETKTLEKLIEPRFKVGDRIRLKNGGSIIEVTSVNNDSSICVNGMSWTIKIKQQDNYELVPNKFNINTLKVFDKVLVRDSNKGMWSASIFSHTWENKYICIGIWYNQCIPYEGNEHLLGTTNDCDEYYKTW